MRIESMFQFVMKLFNACIQWLEDFSEAVVITEQRGVAASLLGCFKNGLRDFIG